MAAAASLGRLALPLARRGAAVSAQMGARALSTSHVLAVRPPKDREIVPELYKQSIEEAGDVTIVPSYDQSLSKTITVEGEVDLTAVTGVPEEHIKERYVRIFRYARVEIMLCLG